MAISALQPWPHRDDQGGSLLGGVGLRGGSPGAQASPSLLTELGQPFCALTSGASPQSGLLVPASGAAVWLAGVQAQGPQAVSILLFSR